MTEHGVKKAQAVRVNDIIGAECATEAEPYILLKALSTAYQVSEEEFNTKPGEYKHNWMGEVRTGDLIIKGLKLDPRAADLYSETSKVFYLFAEDCRGVVKATPLSRKKSARLKGVTKSKASEIIIYEIDQCSLAKVKQLVYLPAS